MNIASKEVGAFYVVRACALGGWLINVVKNLGAQEQKRLYLRQPFLVSSLAPTLKRQLQRFDWPVCSLNFNNEPIKNLQKIRSKNEIIEFLNVEISFQTFSSNLALLLDHFCIFTKNQI